MARKRSPWAFFVCLATLVFVSSLTTPTIRRKVASSWSPESIQRSEVQVVDVDLGEFENLQGDYLGDPAHPFDRPGLTRNREVGWLGATLTLDEFVGDIFVDVLLMGAGTFRELDLRPKASKPWFTGRTANGWPRGHLSNRARGYLCVVRYDRLGSVRASFIGADANTVDPNVNNMLYPLRCPLSRAIQQELQSRRRGQMIVSIVEVQSLKPDDLKSTPVTNGTLLHFSLDVALRTTGWVSFPEAGQSPRFDMWQPRHTIHLALHVGLYGWGLSLNWERARLVVEQLEYYRRFGVEHVWIGAEYPWGSDQMNGVLKLVRSYIDDGFVSVSSSYSQTVFERGVQVFKDVKAVWHANQCLYLSKTIAQWLLVADMDEFMVPLKWPTLPALLDGLGYGRGQTKTCSVIFLSHNMAGKRNDELFWPTQRFQSRACASNDIWQKSFAATKWSYFVGLHVHGLCVLPLNNTEARRTRWGHFKFDRPSWDEEYMHRLNDTLAAGFHFAYADGKQACPNEFLLNVFPQIKPALDVKKPLMERLQQEYNRFEVPMPITFYLKDYDRRR